MVIIEWVSKSTSAWPDIENGEHDSRLATIQKGVYANAVTRDQEFHGLNDIVMSGPHRPMAIRKLSWRIV